MESESKEIADIKQKIENIKAINQSAIAELEKLLVDAKGRVKPIRNGDYGHFKGRPDVTRFFFGENEKRYAYCEAGLLVRVGGDSLVQPSDYTILGNIFDDLKNRPM